jgi:large subunit ribosomal protein L4
MELAVYNSQGVATSKKVKLNDSVFGVEPNDHAIYLDVKQYLANQRQGTSKSKERNEISGSTKKIKKQKGTGGARAGSLKSPVFVGGGRVFGPKPRDYSFKLNKKLKRLARVSALTYKAKDNKIVVLEDLKFDAPKTSSLSGVLKALNLNGKALLVTADYDKNIVLSGRNLVNAKVSKAADLSTYEILNAGSIVLSESAVELVNKLSEN